MLCHICSHDLTQIVLRDILKGNSLSNLKYKLNYQEFYSNDENVYNNVFNVVVHHQTVEIILIWEAEFNGIDENRNSARHLLQH